MEQPLISIGELRVLLCGAGFSSEDCINTTSSAEDTASASKTSIGTKSNDSSLLSSSVLSLEVEFFNAIKSFKWRRL